MHAGQFALVAALTVLLSAGPAGATADAATAKKPVVYKNCTALNKKYPHGVGAKGAHDKIGGKATSKSVTTFKVDTATYKANKKSDRDGDGVACEKR